MLIRKATVNDVKHIHKLLHTYGSEGDLIPRPLSRLYDHVRDFSVAISAEGQVTGCCALQFCWEDLAEIRSLAVEAEHRKSGIGSHLVERCIQEARDFGMNQLFCLTFKPDYFGRFGFRRIDKSELPVKTWADCMLCVQFPDCDGIAMKKQL